MYSPEYLFNIDMLPLISLLVIACLSLVLMFKVDKIKRLHTIVDKLKKSVEEMDEQAKLIVRTDMELNKAQEELDKKITGLYALQKLSRLISTSLEEKQIFKRIEASSLEELGFEKACGLLWNNKEDKFIPYLSIGYLNDEIDSIMPAVNSDRDTYLDLIKNEMSLSSISNPENIALREKINQLFKVNSFVISPILPKEGSKGFFFAGTEHVDVVITAGDEELITILANEIGQALENARLFENTWRAHQELEKKVEERTKELTTTLEELKKVSKRKTDFITSVSHELRTPLTSIKGYAAILLEEKLGVLPAQAKQRLEKINYHSDELVHMINDLLDIARIESGRMALRLEHHDLNGIIATVTDLILIQCKNKNIELLVKVEKDMPLILADRNQIERVFINLLGNAVKFTPANGKITIKVHIKNGMIQVDISDTGIGIPSGELPLIFEEFYRVDNPINQQLRGTGLGLSLVKHIIEAHKGRIWVESKLNMGSTFSFTLPVK